jgi:hypothetical protein
MVGVGKVWKSRDALPHPPYGHLLPHEEREKVADRPDEGVGYIAQAACTAVQISSRILAASSPK